MSYPAYPPPRKPLPANVSVPKPLARQKRTGLIVAVFMVLFFGVSAIGLSVFLPCFKAVKNSQTAADLFLRDLEKQRYKSAEKRTYVNGEGESLFDDLRSTMKRVQKGRGRIVGHTGPEQRSVNSINDPQDVRLVYRAKYKNGSSAPVVLYLSWKDSENHWFVEGMEFK